MDIGKNKLKSIIKQVQNSAEVLANKNIPKKLDRSSSITSSSTSSINTKLDLPSAIEYNYCLINSYLQERNQRKLSPHEEILKTLVDEEHDEDFIINSISKEFFLDPKSLEENNNNNNSNTDNYSNYCDVLSDQPDINCDHLDGQSKIIEMCVLNKLPEFSEAAPHLGDEFLNYLENEKKKLNRQQTIVSKKLTELILINDGQFKQELERVRLIENDLSTAVQICSNGRQSFQMSKKNFTETSINIIENYRLREAIFKIIECLQNIKKLRQTIEHIEYMLQYEKNFSDAINLFDEKFEILETMSKKYLCVAKMKEKLVQTLQLVDDQMDTVLAKMTERFCLETFKQLCKAYSQIDKSESSINQLLLHFHNAIHDKAFSIVLGYVKLFTPEDHLVLLSTTTIIAPANASSTPIKNSNKNKTTELNNQQQSESNNLKRKPFNELCQYLNPESFLQCLTDLCRALWDIMNNYHQILCFFQKEELRCAANLTENEIKFAIDKLTYGVLRVWSDVQHKIRTLVSSVKFVQTQNDDLSAINDFGVDQQNQNPLHHQDQLLFSFEEFIKILTICERMIEIGEQFCDLYYNRKTNDQSFDTANNNDNDDNGASAGPIDSTIEFQQTLYQQTRAYFQSYHQVSMCELKIFLENEIWTRCPIDTNDEFELIANLQEFAFIKNRLLKVKSTFESDSPSKTRKDSNRSANNTKPTTSSSYLLSPVTKAKKYFNISYFQQPDDVDIDNVKADRSITSPFDGIITRIVSQQTFDDSDFDDDDDDDHNNNNNNNDKNQEDSKYMNHNQSNNNLEIVTTNTTLNVLRLVGRYMNIMFLLRPISHDIIKALLELFDYYFYTVYHFYAMDLLNVSWLMNGIFDQHSNHYQNNNNNNNLADKISSCSTTTTTNANNQQTKLLLNHFSSFIRRINDTLILNNNDQSSPTHHLNRIITNNNNNDSPSKKLSPKATNIKYPCPNLPEYVSIESATNHYALGERIIAIQSLIFITRQFYNLCPFLLEFLRFDDDQQQLEYDSISQQKQNIWSDRRKSAEDGFKLLQFYYDKMCSSVESLQFQCLYAVSSKLLPYEMIIQQMSQIKWDLKEIPSIHSSYVNVFIKLLYEFDPQYRNLLESFDLQFLLPDNDENNYKQLSGTATSNRNEDTSTSDLDDEMPLIKLLTLSQRMNIILWQCILKISNRTFIEGFSTAKKCTNEGRALMQLDYEQFLSHIEKLLMPYFKKAFTISDAMNISSLSSSSGDNNNSNQNNLTIKTILKSYLANERLYVEEYVKAYYITESAFIEWIKQRPDYTTKQIVSLINCITVDNKKLRSSLLAAIETMPSLSNTTTTTTIPSSSMIDQNHSSSTTTIVNNSNNVNHFN